MAITTALTRLLGITHPIILAPMGGVAGGKLAAAVSQAGGFGIIGGGYGDPKAGYGGKAWMEDQFRAAGNAQIGVGYITWSLALFPDLFDQAMERAPKAFFLSFGDEKPFASRIKAAGVTFICQIQDLDGAKLRGDEANARDRDQVGFDLLGPAVEREKVRVRRLVGIFGAELAAATVRVHAQRDLLTDHDRVGRDRRAQERDWIRGFVDAQLLRIAGLFGLLLLAGIVVEWALEIETGGKG